MIADTKVSSLSGGCTCGAVRYRLRRSPIIVHCCHCRYCQRESGSAFVVNLMIEADAVDLERESPRSIHTPSASGRGQKIFRCPHCQIAVWSNYRLGGNQIHFVRGGTLDAPDLITPDIHIFTESRMPWVQLPEDVAAVPQYYRRSAIWPASSIARYDAAKALGNG